MVKIFNFCSGPAMLPIDVLKQFHREFFDWKKIGIPILEIGHRSKEFEIMAQEAKRDLRDLLNIPLNYKILFSHGGGRGQFAALPLNLLGKKNNADYVNTGYWSSSAIKEAKKYCIPNVIDARVNNNGIFSIKSMNNWNLSKDAAYMHYCPNETIDGIAIHEQPDFDKTIVVAADLSSTILSTPIDVNKYGVIYASAQKNIGISGLTLIIIRDDLIGKTHNTCPSILNYSVLNENDSLFNTPSTLSWYLASLVFKWLKDNGGITAIDTINKKKANLIYNTIDNSHIYTNNVSVRNRSFMNITFHLVDKKMEELFLKKSNDAGLLFLKGHRFAGGIRASIYNAMPLEGIKSLIDFMIEFERYYA